MYFTRQDLQDMIKESINFYNKIKFKRGRPDHSAEKEFGFFGNISKNKLSFAVSEQNYQCCIYFEIPLKGPTKDIFDSLRARATATSPMSYKLFHDPCECCKSTTVGVIFQHDYNCSASNDKEFIAGAISRIIEITEYCHINQVVEFACSMSQNNKKLSSRESCVLNVVKCLGRMGVGIDSGSMDVLSIIIDYY